MARSRQLTVAADEGVREDIVGRSGDLGVAEALGFLTERAPTDTGGVRSQARTEEFGNLLCAGEFVAEDVVEPS